MAPAPRRLHAIRGFVVLGTALPVFWFAIMLQLWLGARVGWFPINGRLGFGATPPPKLTGFYTVDSLLSGQSARSATHVSTRAAGARAGRVDVRAHRRVSEKSFASELTRPMSRPPWRAASALATARRHVLRNALNPIVTILGLQFGWLLGGTVLVEVVFSWGGVGTYMYTALLTSTTR